MSKKQRIYIAGKMRGEECYNFERFFYWAHIFRHRGFDPINPAQIDCEKWLNEGWIFTEDQYEEVLEADLKLIEEEAGCVFMLYGWPDSEGACREHAKAKELGLPIRYEQHYTPKELLCYQETTTNE